MSEDERPSLANLPPRPGSLKEALRGYTAARIALPRAGNAIATTEQLQFQMDHALARDAVHSAWDSAGIAAQLRGLGLHALELRSAAAASRHLYLRRPDLGRLLDDRSAVQLRDAAAQASGGMDLLILLGDGLSARAVERNALPLLRELLPHSVRLGWRLGPVGVVTGARVALGDPAGELLGATLTLMLIGERPGLSAPDSLGAYLTWGPRTGRTDAERNCISNIRNGGLECQVAAERIARLIGESLRLAYTGVNLKESSTDALPGSA